MAAAANSAGDASAAAAAAPAPRDITVGVLLFPGFEPLDVVGPVSVFGSVPGIKLVYIAQAAGPVTSVTGTMTLVADTSCADLHPATATTNNRQLNWLLVPGGLGTRQEVHNEALLQYIRDWCAPTAGLSLVMSVCTGSALLAAAGVLDARRATSNKIAWQWVTSLNPKVNWVRKARWVQDGPFLTSSGVSAGTDAAVCAVKTLLSPQEAAAAAKRLEHLPATAADQDPFADEAFMPPV